MEYLAVTEDGKFTLTNNSDQLTNQIKRWVLEGVKEVVVCEGTAYLLVNSGEGKWKSESIC